jgi:hypothetical protein
VAAILQVYTQQSVESRRGRWRVGQGERVAGAERAGGTLCCRLGRRIKSAKITRDRDGAMAIGGRHYIGGNNNQPKFGVGRGRDMDEARDCGGTYGGKRFATV